MIFAGSTLVHSVGGWAALVGARLLKPRVGRYGKNGTIKPIPGHNMPLASIGVFSFGLAGMVLMEVLFCQLILRLFLLFLLQQP